MLLVKPAPPLATKATQPFRWWFLLYLVVQNALVMAGLDWLFAWLLHGKFPTLSTFILAGIIVALTVVGYITATNSALRPKQPLRPEMELTLEADNLTLRYFNYPHETVQWRDVALLEWQEGNFPPMAVMQLYPNSALYKARAAADRPLFVVLELTGFEIRAHALYEQLEQHWRAAKQSRSNSQK
ncbi:MAG: hypothetical protein HXX08_16200 [Chloroflexi bacterium]|uniref:PH domain-containing protein n=1 Tax=Candidatus Chlorohelix allophototropha TaxID=3003348 RepID=A0A8T7M5M0_9CHLR|nr:hypothetical protein [Chloroflexota bacterium]WJW69313.1 hypothetical protein OZ401_002921 [Chloroflexota bacterium L227-S17]